MRRDAFGPFATLSDIDLARLLALVGAGVGLRKLQGDVARVAPPKLFAAALPVLQVNVHRIERFGSQVRKKKAIGIVGSVNEAARSVWLRKVFQKQPGFRLAIDVAGASSDPAMQVDVRWLNQLLVEGLPGNGGAIVVQPSAPRSFKWDWPLQTGVLVRDDGPLASQVKDGFRYERLLEQADLNKDGATCELLLVAGSLTDAVQYALESRVEASLVVVLGDNAASWHETQALIQIVRSRMRAAVVACCVVGPVDRRRWLESLVEGLTHNLPVDQALLAACQQTNKSVPLVMGDGRFVALSAISETAKRIGRALADAPSSTRRPFEPFRWTFSLPPGMPTRTSQELGVALVLNADRMLWTRERGDATALVTLREAVARSDGEFHHAARIEAGKIPKRPVSDAGPARGRVARARTLDAAPDLARPEFSREVPFSESAAPPNRLETPRWVQAAIYGAGGRRRTAYVAAQSTYALEVAISPSKSLPLIAPRTLDETALQPSEAGHSLKIAFTPLWHMDGQGMHPAQMQHVHLPVKGDSSKASFYFRTPADARSVRARLVVLAENRVLQTLMLEPVDRVSEAEAKLTLRLETVVSADLGDRSVAPAFGASIVINEDAAGSIGLTVIAGDQVEFFEPAGLDNMVKQMATELATLNTGVGSTGESMGLDHPAMQNLLLGLALKGHSLHEAIIDQSALKSMAKLRHVQFVEAVPKGYFPIELAYDGVSPSLSATLCPNAAKALVDEGVHAGCPHAASADHHCPAAFWGFSKCIERHTESATGQHRFAQPTRANDVLRPFSSVLLGASNNVLPESLDPPKGIRAILERHGMQYSRAADWKEWRSEVSARSPSTLLLLPHSDNSVQTFHVPAIEIGGDLMPVGGLLKEHVIGPGSRYPLVLVLGCSTGLTEIAFVNSISRFRKAGAAVTLGTVALITGRQTVRFVEKLLEGLKAAAAKNLAFDEAYLQVKRAMLAEGNPFVLSLVAYGDSGWRLEL